MVEKFFLSLDYKSVDEALAKGSGALEFLKSAFGDDFVNGRVGVKLNEDLLTHTIDPRLRGFAEGETGIFADMKIAHGADTGERIVDRILAPENGNLPIKYVTVSAGLGPTILGKYVEFCTRRGIHVVAFTAHTKIPDAEACAMYSGNSLRDAIYNLSEGAARAGCHAAVMEGKQLKDPRIQGLRIKKLVTGIRIDPSDAGSQSRVTSLAELAEVKPYADLVVVSSRYLDKPDALRGYFEVLL
ncbi:hypothetical protein HY501_03325 [Candidatus Woesearchaeota archaeon]|nr:hypothetical protein [Candidatus Woesearchaeota archaeon]